MVVASSSIYVKFLLLPWLFIAPSVQGFNYLFQALVGEGSHFLAAAHLAEVLVHRGHNVTFIISSACSYHETDPRWGSLFEFVVYENPHPDHAFRRTTNEFIARSFEEGIAEGQIKHYPKILSTLALDCDSILSNETLLTKLRDKHFNLLFYDDSWVCSQMLADKINLKTILIHPSAYFGGMAGMLGASPGLSYTPLQLENIPTPPLSFYNRLHSVVSLVYQGVMFSTQCLFLYEALREKHNVSRHLRVDEFIQSGVQLSLFNMDAEVEMLVPLTPNIIPVGGLTTTPAQQLPKELNKIMETVTEEGVVVFSLGSYVNNFPRRVQDVILEAFSRLPYQIFFKYDNKDNITLPPNVRVLKWLPLNDLLGHEKTKVFVYQGGNNGFYEAVYHGVPTVVLPILGDQGHVAAITENRGIGVSLNIRTMTAHDLKDAIVKVMTDSSIRNNIQRMRDIYRHKPMNATQRAAYWVEHVSKFGGLPYKPNAFHLNIFQYSLLDVILFLLTVLICFLRLLYKSCSLCCRSILK